MSLFWLFELCFCDWLFGLYETSHAISQNFELYALPLRYEYFLTFGLFPLYLVRMKVLLLSVISHKIGLQALYWLETVRKNILAIG